MKEPPNQLTQNGSTKSRGTWAKSICNIWLPVALIFAVGACLCCSIWGKTGDIVGDFGDDLYDAWRVSQGKLLFRDVACFFGPLSPNINALIMRVAGRQFNVILVANLIILILTTALLYRFVRAISGTLTALVATIFFLCVFALSAPTKIADFNFLTPYRHQVIHGFLLTLCAIACLDRFQRRRSIAPVALGGFLTGLVFLTKPEIFLGCAATYFLGLVAIIWADRNKCPARIFVSAGLAAVVPPMGFLIFYALQMPFRTALGGVLGGWQFVGKPFVISTPFYKGDFGSDRPLQNLLQMFKYAGLYAAAAVVLAAVAILANKALKRSGRATVGAVGVLVGAAFFFLVTRAGSHFDSFWPDVARGFPLFATFAIAISAVRIAQARAQRQCQPEAILQFALSILSFVLLLKIFLNVRMYHYGFVLSAPCAMLMIVTLCHWLPAWVRRMDGSVAIVRLGTLGLLAACVAKNLALTRQNLQERTIPIPLALGGVAWSRPFDSASIDAIKWLSTTPATAAVIPDAAGINYAAGRPSSIPFTEMHPMGLAIFGEQNVAEAFDRHPPDYILIMEVQEDAFGARTFDRDYGLRLSTWISSNYRYIGKFSSGSRPIELWIFNPPKAPGDHR
jgi:hypothetical protein